MNFFQAHNPANDVNVFYLNGIAGVYREDMKVVYCPGRNIDSILEFIYAKHKSAESLIEFGWETETVFKKHPANAPRPEKLEVLSKLIRDTTRLVVIGYSFFFNRYLDKIIMALANAKLETIYFQSPSSDGQQLYSQFGIPKSVKIEWIKQTDQFHIPYEL